MEPVIRAEHIGKKYILRQHSAGGYQTLSGKLTNSIKGIFTGTEGVKGKSRFGKETFWALDDINFEVQPGERVGIVGRNGAGKSTLLKILSRIVSPTTGKVVLNGRVGSLLEVGTGFHSELSGRENIFLNGSILGMSKEEIKRKFDEIVAFSEVEKFLDTPVKRYSSGMYVRLAFAVAAHLEPEILVVDEVLAVGDAAFQKKCLGKMEDVSASGRTILFVSHHIESVQRLCNKGILLSQGKLIESGNIDQVLAKYLQAQTEGALSYEIRIVPEFADSNALAHTLEITDENDVPVSEIVMGNNFKVKIDIELKTDINDFVGAIGISTAFGQPLRTSWSKPQNLKAGKYKLVFSNDGLMLASGPYKLTVGLSSQGKVFHYADGCATLYISEISSLANDEQIVNSRSGIILNQMPFEFIPVS